MAVIHNFSPLSPRYPGGCWPTKAQTLLLRASLLPKAHALEAWEAWKNAVPFDDIDSGSFRMLGQAFRHLRAFGINDSLLPRMQGVFRRFWMTNQLIIKRNAPILPLFKNNGIPVMLTKGAALCLAVYRDYGARPMEDLDLAVPRSHALAAMSLLEEHGWEPEVQHSKELPQTLHACHFRHPSNGIIDLHWQSFHLPVPDSYESLVWQHAVLCDLDQQQVLTPGMSDLFLRSCEHGVRYNIVPPFRWLADCWKIWECADGKLDWHHIATGAHLTKSVLAVRATLQFLATHLDVKFPSEAFALLSQAPVAWHERIESRLVQRPCRSLLDKLPLDMAWHWRITAGQSLLQRVKSFPEYFRHSNNLTHGQFSRHHRAQVKRWFRQWLPYYIHRTLRPLTRRSAGAISRLSADDLRGFHPLEPFRHRLFSWSNSQASVRLPRPTGPDYKITIETRGFRAWHTDLKQSFALYINGQPAPAFQVTSKHGHLTIRVQGLPASVATQPHMEIGWSCQPMHCEGDERDLGLPVFQITVHTWKSQNPDDKK